MSNKIYYIYWNKIQDVLSTYGQADTGKCGKLCYVRIPETANTPESRHLLKVGEAIVDPLNECNRYFCEVSSQSMYNCILFVQLYIPYF